MVSKKDYICIVPFEALEVHDHDRVLCCASWLKKSLPKNAPVGEAWESKEANEIRDSILDGSYKYCDSNHCPYLSSLKHYTSDRNLGPLKHRNNLTPDFKRRVDSYKTGKLLPPSNVQFSFDRSCNLNCPSCRVEMFIADSWKIKQVHLTVEEIEKTFSKDLKSIYITGSGDPFISVGFRNFLRNFDPQKYPKLQSIHLHTNATKWNRKMWDSMKAIHPYVKSCEISIDAATKDTYENKTRLGGNWDELMDNLRFISTIPTLKSVKPSFVVQQMNYKEIEPFYNLMKKIFIEDSTVERTLKVYFGKITNWGTYTDSEFKTHKVWDETHPEFSEFKDIVKTLVKKTHLFHNLHEFIQVDQPKQVLI